MGLNNIEVTLQLTHVPFEEAKQAVEKVRKLARTERGPLHLETFADSEKDTNILVAPTSFEASTVMDVDGWFKRVNQAVYTVCGRSLEGYWFSSGDEPDCINRFRGTEMDSLESSWVFELPMDLGRALRNFAFTFSHDRSFQINYIRGAIAAYAAKLREHVRDWQEIENTPRYIRKFKLWFKDDIGKKMSPFDLKLLTTGRGDGGFDVIEEGPDWVKFEVDQIKGDF